MCLITLLQHNSIAAFLREFSLYRYYLLAIAVLQGVKEVFSLLGCKYLVKEVRSFCLSLCC